jgi:hypothetical protein
MAGAPLLPAYQPPLNATDPKWLQQAAIETVAATVPSGGVGGTAALATSVGQFVHRAKKVIDPIIGVANDVKDFAEDVGFSTSCGWSDWHD